MIVGHNMFDSVKTEQFGYAAPIWNLLHQPGLLDLGSGLKMFVLYPLIPWIGVMAAGYALARFSRLSDQCAYGGCFGWVQQSRSRSFCCVQPMFTATPHLGPYRTAHWRLFCHSSIAKNIRRRCSIWR